MDKSTHDLFEEFKIDLNNKLKNQDYHVGDNGPSNSGKDYGRDHGNFLFKIYPDGENHPSKKYQEMKIDCIKLMDYSTLSIDEKEALLSSYIEKINPNLFK